LAGLFLAAAYAKVGRTQDAAAVVSAYSAARVRQGAVPFVMREVAGHPGSGRSPLDIKPPEKVRLYQALKLLSIPDNFDAPQFASQRLNGKEIEALLFGRRVHGRSLGKGTEYGMFISADGATVTNFGEWDNGAQGTAHIKDDLICTVLPTNEWCVAVYRNPGGTRERENEYFFFDGWAITFSRAD
jgi:hypothetical protein